MRDKRCVYYGNGGIGVELFKKVGFYVLVPFTIGLHYLCYAYLHRYLWLW